MSRSTIEFDPAELPSPLCRYCGFAIDEQGHRCAALDEGACAP